MDAKEAKRIVGRNVKYYRYKFGYSQEQLAERINLSTRYVSDIENGKGNITIDTLTSLATCFNINLSNLTEDVNRVKLPKKINMK